MPLPPGQRALDRPPRFGLDKYMSRRAVIPPGFLLRIEGDVEHPLELAPADLFPSRSERATDLHCVTTWSALGLRWSGMPFRAFWDEVVVPRARPRAGVAYLRLSGLDDYAATLPLEDALHDDTFLADRLDGDPLGDHGAPLRLVLPHLYAYKSVKHLCRIEATVAPLRPSAGRLLGHPRGRVALEERSGAGLQRFWRLLYRALLPLFLWRARSLSARLPPAEPR